MLYYRCGGDLLFLDGKATQSHQCSVHVVPVSLFCLMYLFLQKEYSPHYCHSLLTPRLSFSDWLLYLRGVWLSLKSPPIHLHRKFWDLKIKTNHFSLKNVLWWLDFFGTDFRLLPFSDFCPKMAQLVLWNRKKLIFRMTHRPSCVIKVVNRKV